jgi:hypothetical protein
MRVGWVGKRNIGGGVEGEKSPKRSALEER